MGERQQDGVVTRDEGLPMPVTHRDDPLTEIAAHLRVAEEELGWIGTRRRRPLDAAEGVLERLTALTELAEDERPGQRCWQALHNAAEKLHKIDRSAEVTRALGVIDARLDAAP